MPNVPNWGWKDYQGDFNQDILYNTQRRAGDTAGALLDFSSPFYSAYGSYLNKATPGVGAGSFLSMLQAGGGNYAGSMSQAMQLKGNEDKKRRDAINTGIQGFAAGNLGTAGSMLGLQGNIGSTLLQAQIERERMEQEKGGFLDSLGGILGTVGGFALGGPLGGMLGGSLGGMFGGGMARRAR